MHGVQLFSSGLNFHRKNCKKERKVKGFSVNQKRNKEQGSGFDDSSVYL
jgi:hypothetical protein